MKARGSGRCDVRLHDAMRRSEKRLFSLDNGQLHDGSDTLLSEACKHCLSADSRTNCYAVWAPLPTTP